MHYLAGIGSARKRFAREARAAAAVVHDHVVPIHNVETERETPFLVMKYIGGESLQCRIDRQGALELCKILLSVSQSWYKEMVPSHCHPLNPSKSRA